MMKRYRDTLNEYLITVIRLFHEFRREHFREIDYVCAHVFEKIKMFIEFLR